MDVGFSQDDGKIIITFSRHDGDGIFSQKIKMNSDLVGCDFGNNLQLGEIHQDHLALASILLSNPFVSEELIINGGMSERFFEATKRITKYKVKKPESFIEPYNSVENSRPSLSFSGGADSTAALLLMPKNTLSVFLDRPLKFGRSLYNKSAAYATIEHAKSEGYEVKKIDCELSRNQKKRLCYFSH